MTAREVIPRATGEWWKAGLLVALVGFVYWPTLANGFIWDDDGYVQNNLTLRTAHGLASIWLELGAVPQYYPLVHTTFWLEHHLWELDPRGYHAVNLLLHASAALLLWRLLLRLAVPGAWLAAAIFAVHPVHVESVAWITERKNVLSLNFALGAMLAYLRFSPPESDARATLRSGWRPYLLALLLYAAALLSKTVTASVPAVLLVLRWWKRGRVTWRDGAWLTPFVALGLALSSITLWMERTHVGARGAEWDLSGVERVLVAGRALWFYAGKLFWPHPLIFFYPRWDVDAHSAWQYLFPLAALAVFVGLWRVRGTIGRGPLAAVLIFAGVLVPALGFFNVYPFRYSFVADHFQYHASIGLIALAGASAAALGQRLHPRPLRVATVVAVAALMLLAVVARRETYVYRSVISLYEDVIAKNPESWAARNNLGRHLQNQSEFQEAIVQFREALRLRPDLARIRNNLGSALSSLERYDEARSELSRALVSDGDDVDRADSHVYLGVVEIQQQHYDDAIAHLRSAAQLRPGDAWTLYNLGVAIGGSGDLATGAERIRDALALDPESAVAQHELGAMLMASGEPQRAVAPFREAVRLAPENAKFQEDLGVALLQSGALQEAEVQLASALALDPRSADAHNWRGIALGRSGDLAAAVIEFEAALHVDPSHVQAAGNLQRAKEAIDGQR